MTSSCPSPSRFDGRAASTGRLCWREEGGADASALQGLQIRLFQTTQPLARNQGLPTRVRTGTRVRSCGACGGSWLLPKIGMMFAVDCFCRTVACMQGGLQLCAAVDIGRILDSQVLLKIPSQFAPASLVRSLWRA